MSNVPSQKLYFGWVAPVIGRLICILQTVYVAICIYLILRVTVKGTTYMKINLLATHRNYFRMFDIEIRVNIKVFKLSLVLRLNAK